MTNMQRKIATATATLAMLANTALPVFADTDLVISGNGSDSDSDINLQTSNNTTVVQTNNTEIDNDIDIDANTGNNKANDNTGGDVEVKTGDVDVYTHIDNTVNANTANVDNCGSCLDDTTVAIVGNGTESDNDVKLNVDNDTQVFQENYADIDNDVDVDADSGNNEAEDNTGGDTSIKTGDVDVTTKAHNTANSNSAWVGSDSDGSGSLDVYILENGSDSDNDVDLDLDRDVLLSQLNSTEIENDFDVDASSGENDADDNTGGEVMIETGDVDVYAHVDNMAGFNWANLDDCCFDNIFAKVAGNGTDTDNRIAANLDNDLEVFQDNVCGDRPFYGGLELFSRDRDGRGDDCIDNDLDIEAVTGENEGDDNTSHDGADPSIKTGDADVEVQVDNTGGSNVYGDDSGSPFDHDDHEDDEGGWNVEVTLNFQELLEFLGISIA